MGWKKDDKVTIYFSIDGQKWYVDEEAEETAKYKVVTEKVYAFFDYNKVQAYVRDEDDWVEAPEDAPQARVIEARPLAEREIEEGLGTLKSLPAEVEFHLPVRLVDEELAHALEGIRCRGMRGRYTLQAADSFFYIALDDREKAERRLREAGWDVIDKSVRLLDITKALEEAREALAQAGEIIAWARSICSGEITEQDLTLMDTWVEEVKSLRGRVDRAVGRVARLDTRLQGEPARSADKARGKAAREQAKELKSLAAKAVRRIKELSARAQEKFDALVSGETNASPLEDFEFMLDEVPAGGKERWEKLAQVLEAILMQLNLTGGKMGWKKDDNVTVYFSIDGQKWYVDEEAEETAEYKVVTEKVYSFSDYNSVQAYVRDEDDWVEAPEDAPQARVIEASPLAEREIEEGLGTLKSLPAEVQFQLPVRLVDEELAHALEGIRCRGMRGRYTLQAADSFFYIALDDREKAERRLREAGWDVIDKSVRLPDITKALEEAREALAQAGEIIAWARSICSGEITEQDLTLMDTWFEEVKSLRGRVDRAVDRVARLDTRLQGEPARSADKARGKAAREQAKELKSLAAKAVRRIEELSARAQEEFAALVSGETNASPLEDFEFMLGESPAGGKERWEKLAQVLEAVYPAIVVKTTKDGLLARLGESIVAFSGDRILALQIGDE